jgi:hypothetical protein
VLGTNLRVIWPVLLLAASGVARALPADPFPGAGSVSRNVAAVEGNDIALPSGGAITGMVTAALDGTPLQGAVVTVSGPNGIIQFPVTDSGGVYRTSATLPAGIYHLQVSPFRGFLGQLYRGITCRPTCPAEAVGTPVSVAEDTITSGIDFALEGGATISGTVRAATDGSPLVGARVSIASPDLGPVWYGQTETGGRYATSTLLPAGTYYVQAHVDGYLPQAYDGVNCGFYCPNYPGTPIVLAPGASTSGIDFSLVRGGAVTGVVSARESGAPLSGVSVSLFGADGTGGYWWGTTDTTGRYFTTTALPTGTYYLSTAAGSGYLGQLFSNIVCGEVCPLANQGTPVAVTQGVTTGGIDFALSKGGLISGVVTAAATGAPLPGAMVELFDATGARLSETATDVHGEYLTTLPLPSGTFFLRARALDYLNQNYGGVNCGQTCPPVTQSTPVTVTLGSTAPGKDFVLVAGGAIAGTVRAAGTGTLLPGVGLYIADAAGRQVDWATTNESGAFQTRNALPTGTYFVWTLGGNGYLGQVFDGIDCAENCPLATAGTPVSVSQGATSAGVNFSLARVGAVAGTVRTGTGAAVAGANVTVKLSNGTWVAGTSSNADGTYSIPSVSSGSYYVQVWAAGFVGQIYNGVNCGVTCPNLNAGTAVQVTAGATTSGVDFALVGGGTVSGTVRAADGGVSSATLYVEMYSADGTPLATTTTDVGGAYSLSGFATGNYYLRTRSATASLYFDQVYSGVNCSLVSCPPVTSGTPVTVTQGATTRNIDFALVRGGRITGRVTAAGAGTPVENVAVSVYDAAGRRASNLILDGQGGYLTADPLPTGTYYVMAEPGTIYLSQLYGGVNCGLSCPSVLTGTPVSVTAGATTSGIDFALTRRATIVGTVRAAAGGAVIFNAWVSVFSALNELVGVASTGPDGKYATDALLETGTYYLSASAGTYVGQVYRNVNCRASCPPVTSGQPVRVTTAATTTGIDFALGQGGGMSGLVLDATMGSPVGGVSILVLDGDGRQVASGTSNATGAWATTVTLPTGSYRVRTSNSSGYVDQQFAGTDCPGGACAAADGTPVNVSAPYVTHNINFLLRQGGSISGVVTNADGSAPIGGVSVHVFRSSGVDLGAATTNAEGGYRWSGLPAGTYFVATANALRVVDQLYGGIDCPRLSCVPTTGSPVTVALEGTTSGIDFRLAPGGWIGGSVRYREGSVRYSRVAVYSATGLKLGTAWTSAVGAYEMSVGLPTGSYFVRTETREPDGMQLGLGFGPGPWVDQVYNGLDCDGAACPPVTAGTPVIVTGGALTASIDFALSETGCISGAVRTSDSVPLARVTVHVVDGTGTIASTTSTEENGTYSTLTPLGAGPWYVRTSNTMGYVDRLYGGGACPNGGCILSSGSPVSVTAGATTSGIDFVLEPGGGISGVVTTTAGGGPVAGITVAAFDGSGAKVGEGLTNALGAYTTSAALPAGAYFVRTRVATGFFAQLYAGMPCDGCDVTTGTPVTVAPPATTFGVNFALAPTLPAFTDDPLLPGVTPVKVVHITELREAIATLRARQGLAPVAWTDPTIVPRVTVIKGVHLVELRAAIDAVYQAAGRSAPAWAPATIVGGQAIVAVASLQELRGALAAIW